MSRTTTRSRGKELSVEDDLASLEKLLIAQTVYEFGREAWTTVAQLLTEHPSLDRPKGSFTARSCQAIHSRLLEEASLEYSEADNLARRGQGPSNLKLAQRLYEVRLRELKKNIAEQETRFREVEAEILEIRSGAWDDRIKAKLGIITESPATGDVLFEPEPSKEDVIDLTEPLQPEEVNVQEQNVKQTPRPTKSPLPQVEEEEHEDEVQAEPESKEPVEPEAAIPGVHSPDDDAAVESVIDEPHDSPSTAERSPDTAQETPVVELPKQETPMATPTEGDAEAEDEGMQTVGDTEKGGGEAQPMIASEGFAREDASTIGTVPEGQPPELANDETKYPTRVPSPEVDATATQTQTPAAEEADSPGKTLSQVDEIPTPSEIAPSPNAEDKNPTPAPEEEDIASSNKSPSPAVEIARPSPDPSVEPERPRSNAKRKASDVEVVSSEFTRDKKRARDESQPIEDEEPGPSAGPSKRRASRPANETSQASKKFQTVIGMLHSQISQHRNGNIFHNPIKVSEAPDYYDIVRRPMDLKTIKTRFKEGIIANSAEFQRDIYLMFANSMMYNRPDSDIYTMAEEMMLESEAQINAFRQTEGIIRGGHHRL